MIVVDGSAQLELPVDRFTITAEFRSRNPNQAAGLAELSAALTRARQTASRLEGLQQIKIENSEVSISAVQDGECLEKSGYGADGACPVVGRLASASMTVIASPADRAGPMLSLLSELEAESVSLSGYSLREEADGRRRVLAAAVADARAKAEVMAASSNATLGEVVRIQYGAGFTPTPFGADGIPDFIVEVPQERQVATGQAVRPATGLDLDPRPMRVEARVTVGFAVRR